jgi:hypothetical protein
MTALYIIRSVEGCDPHHVLEIALRKLAQREVNLVRCRRWGAQWSLESSVSPKYFILWTIGIGKSFIVISEKRRLRLLVKTMAFHFSGAIERKEEDRRFCRRSSELFNDTIARSRFKERLII